MKKNCKITFSAGILVHWICLSLAPSLGNDLSLKAFGISIFFSLSERLRFRGGGGAGGAWIPFDGWRHPLAKAVGNKTVGGGGGGGGGGGDATVVGNTVDEITGFMEWTTFDDAEKSFIAYDSWK